MTRQQDKVLILRHSIGTPPGTTITWLENRKIPFEVFMVPEISNWSELSSRPLIILCGGGMNVDQEELYPWLRKEKAYLLQEIQKGTKILGLCLGAQLLAEVLGAKVHRHDHWEVGWHQVNLSEDKFLPQGISSLVAFQFHGYRFHLPAGAKRIAHNAICGDQGFRYRENIVGFQFHPEASQEWVLECTEKSGEEPYPEGKFVQAPEQVRNSLSLQRELELWYFEFLDLFWAQP